MRVFVTGGTGLLGNTILRQLCDQGHQTRTLVRRPPDPEVFEGISTDFVEAELDDSATLQQAIAGCDAVIHSAGLIHLGWKRGQESMRVNREGTRHLVTCCLKHDCKLVHVGTVNTLAVGSRTLAADEETPLDHAGGQTPCNYVVSKRAGVQEVLDGVTRGLRAVIVHPGFMLGPWDWKPSSGRMMLEVGRRWRPVAPTGGCSVCDSRDVAAGTLAAMERGGETGRQYILAGENWDYQRLWTEMAVRMGRRPPLFRVGPLMRFAAGLGGDLWARATGREGDLNSAAIRMSSLYHWHDSTRARETLGYRTRDVAESLDASAAWIKERHFR